MPFTVKLVAYSTLHSLFSPPATQEHQAMSPPSQGCSAPTHCRSSGSMCLKNQGDGNSLALESLILKIMILIHNSQAPPEISFLDVQPKTKQTLSHSAYCYWYQNNLDVSFHPTITSLEPSKAGSLQTAPPHFRAALKAVRKAFCFPHTFSSQRVLEMKAV